MLFVRVSCLGPCCRVCTMGVSLDSRSKLTSICATLVPPLCLTIFGHVALREGGTGDFGPRFSREKLILTSFLGILRYTFRMYSFIYSVARCIFWFQTIFGLCSYPRCGHLVPHACSDSGSCARVSQVTSQPPCVAGCLFRYRYVFSAYQLCWCE